MSYVFAKEDILKSSSITAIVLTENGSKVVRASIRGEVSKTIVAEKLEIHRTDEGYQAALFNSKQDKVDLINFEINVDNSFYYGEYIISKTGPHTIDISAVELEAKFKHEEI